MCHGRRLTRLVARFAIAGALLVGSVRAQTIPLPPVGGLGQSQSLFFDDAGAETAWKVFNPTGAGDAFNVDFDQLAEGMTLTGIALSTWQSSSSGPIGLRYVLLAPDHPLDPLGRTPDISAPLSILGSLSGTVTITGTPGISAGFCPSLVGYDLPDVTVGSGGVHAVVSFLTGDSALWLCSDSTAPDARSYFSMSFYSTPATPITSEDLMMRVIGGVNPGTGSTYMTVNNATGVVEVDQIGFVGATLWSSCAVQPTLYIQGVTLPGGPFVQVPPLVLATGFENGSPIADSRQGTVADCLSDPTRGPCVPANISFDVSGYYLDNCDVKPKNGKPKLKATNAVTVRITPNVRACNPCVCFGQADDGSLDGTIWKVANPASSRDFANVNVGTLKDPNSGGTCAVDAILSIQMASWDFCGVGTSTGPSWQSIGLYEGSTIDPSGTPDLAAAVALCTTLSMAPGAADFTYPATTYDFPDVAVSTSTALAGLVNGHVAAEWSAGDTCIWMALDTDGSDDAGSASASCSAIPSTTSYFTTTGYSTPAIQLTTGNWMMRVEWN